MPEPTPTSTPESSAVPTPAPAPECSAVPTPAPAPESSAVPTPAPTRESEAGTVVAAPAPASGGGRLRRSVLGPLTAVVVLAAAAGGWYASGGGSPVGAAVDGTGEAVAPVARSLRLPWPDEGQASVAVEGIGSLGTRGEQKPVPIASLTKVMTAYVILEGHPMRAGAPGAAVVADQRAADESYSSVETTAPVLAGRTYTQRRLLELMMVPSGNNIARLLARWDAGQERAFVAKMNRAAAGLGMRATTYTGVSGMEASTRSTSDDQLRLARAAMKDPVFRQIVATASVTAPGTGATFRNTNRLLGHDGVIGLKTGSSTPAGGNLAWAATQRIAGTTRLVVGVVLHQRAGTTPAEGSAAAHEAGRALITTIRADLPDALTRAGGSGRR
ncbi:MULTISPECIES: D-alanyl-D-alanine carboxypeptidase family protein [unclassified Streptomyces]|uniref:D-alanyl-D-alanine carboxypeptidase family protein n=1 Tax=unclassified Streptomyces TaxID=2593676 RepID=UPI001CC322E4|nr:MULTISPECIES: D-alanyl-D-alanine carboxypeptidase [unclassified Streptomyces]